MASPPSITPATRVADLLEAYPALEPVLIAQAPAFARLRNPILRWTVARVATLQQAAAVGGLSVRALVVALRQAAGQPIDEAGVEGSASAEDEAFAPEQPAWVKEARLSRVIDAEALLASGQVPLPSVADAARALEPGDSLRVDAHFRPVPLLDALGRQGFRCWVREVSPERFEAYFGRRP